MLGCHAVRERLSDEADGQLTGWRAFYVRFHARICPTCKAVKRSLDETVSVLHALRDEPEESEAEKPPRS